MWVLYLILIALGLALICGVYLYTRAHSGSESRTRDERPPAEAGPRAERMPTGRRRTPVSDERPGAAAASGAKQDSRALILSVRLPEAGVPAATVIEVLRRLGFTPGEHQIYHRLDADGTVLFSVADLFEPGILHPLSEDARLRGLAFFFEARPGAAAIARLDRMLGAVHECAERLGGRIEDREHHPLTAARELELKLAAAGARGG